MLLLPQGLVCGSKASEQTACSRWPEERLEQLLGRRGLLQDPPSLVLGLQEGGGNEQDPCGSSSRRP